jgi:hypothetical protein
MEVTETDLTEEVIEEGLEIDQEKVPVQEEIREDHQDQIRSPRRSSVRATQEKRSEATSRMRMVVARSLVHKTQPRGMTQLTNN